MTVPPINPNILVDQDFISHDRSRKMIGAFDVVSGFAAGSQILMVHGADTLGIRDVVDRIVARLQSYFTDPSLREDQTTMMAMNKGTSQPLHADAEQEVDGVWQENHSPWRTHVALLYLTTGGREHIGGALRLPTQGFTFIPWPGLLIAFPATREYAHEVTEVVEGTRYSLAVWLRND